MSYRLLTGGITLDSNRGSIVILSIIVGAIMFLLSSFLLYSIYLDHQIANSSIDHLQSYYLAEDKIYLCFDEGSSYYDELILGLKHYLKYKQFGNSSNKNLIIIDEEDLNPKDTKNEIKLDMFMKNNILNGGILAQSDYKNINKRVYGAFTFINPFYSTDKPILSKNTLEDLEEGSIDEFMEQLFNDFKLETFENDIEIIEVNDFQKIDIYFYDEKTRKIRLDFFRYKDEKTAVCKKYLSTDEIYLISKDKMKNSEINIYANDVRITDILKGIIYVDGDLNLYGKLNFNGIVAINSGKVNVYSKDRPKIRGMFILNNYKDDEETIEEKIDLQYRQVVVDRFGLYIPDYIKPNLYLVKEGGTIEK